MEFVNMCRKRFRDASKELAEKLFKKYSFSAVLIWAETSLLEQIIISLAKKFKIPIIILQHGLYSNSPELVTKNKFHGVIPKTSDMMLVWGPKFKEYWVKNGFDEIIFGTEFGCITDVDMGPDGSIYVTCITDNAIYKILPK